MTPRVLFLDIETLPFVVTSWSADNPVPLSHDNILREAEMLCAAWKWEGHKKVYSCMAPPTGGDKALTAELQRVIGEADAVVAHFGDAFDLPWIQARCLAHNLGPLKPVVQIDTWKIAKSKFRLFNRKLDYLAKYLKLGAKLETNYGLWKACMQGDSKARARMLKYNKQDVVLLERVYQRLAPFVAAKLNRALFASEEDDMSRTCPTCGTLNSLRIKGRGFTRTGVRIALRCAACLGWCYIVRKLAR